MNMKIIERNFAQTMRNDYLIRAVKEDTKNVLAPVINAAYTLEPLSRYELMDIAVQVNDQLGYFLFDDLHYPRLVRDFALVARAMQRNAVKGDLHEFR